MVAILGSFTPLSPTDRRRGVNASYLIPGFLVLASRVLALPRRSRGDTHFRSVF